MIELSRDFRLIDSFVQFKLSEEINQPIFAVNWITRRDMSRLRRQPVLTDKPAFLTECNHTLQTCEKKPYRHSSILLQIAFKHAGPSPDR